MRSALVLVLVAACNAPAPAAHDGAADPPCPAPEPRPAGMIDGACDGQPGAPRVLVYSYENLWRHLSNYYARAALFAMCKTRGFHVETTNDPHAFTAQRLASFDVVVFAVTSGSGMSAADQQDFEAWVRAGGGVVGLEGAAATEPQWPFFAANLGASFQGHAPENVRATVRLGGDDPITQGLPALDIIDQWYVFPSHPELQAGLQVVMTLDESTLPPDYPSTFREGYHPLGWTYAPFGGRVFYTALGDAPGDFSNATILELLGRGIEWAAHRR